MEGCAGIAGAEAEVEETEFLGRPAMVKIRPPKGYRLPELDAHIRSTRTRSEARIMHEARLAGVRTPCIYDLDLTCKCDLSCCRCDHRFPCRRCRDY